MGPAGVPDAAIGGAYVSTVSMEIGTSIAIEFTAYPETVSLAWFTELASSAAVRTGGDLWVFKVSKAPPRSIQKPSSVFPANVLIPFVVVVIAALNKAS